MKIVVIGGTGLIGSKLVEKLSADGHDALAASPDTGVNTLTGEGLAEALEGAAVVVDVANAPVWDDAAVLDFFQTTSRNVARRSSSSSSAVSPTRASRTTLSTWHPCSSSRSRQTTSPPHWPRSR